MRLSVMKPVRRRDRQYGKSEWTGCEFSVIDTGGWVVNSDDIFEEEIRKQVTLATEEADVVLFFGGCPERCDGSGRSRGQYLAAYQKPVILRPTRPIRMNGYIVPQSFTLWGWATPIVFRRQPEVVRGNCWTRLSQNSLKLLMTKRMRISPFCRCGSSECRKVQFD